MSNNKEIKYSGYTAQPSDYDAPDGSLAQSLNLININGALTPMNAHTLKFTVPDNTSNIFIHHPSSSADDIYIAVVTPPDNPRSSLLYALPENPDTPFASIQGFHTASVLGNTLIIATDSGLRYFLFKDNVYIDIGSKIPFPSIAFSPYHIATLDDKNSSTIPDCPRNTATRLATNTQGLRPADPGEPTDDDKAAMTAVSNSVFGLLLSSVKEKITEKGYFYQPFFVRYAIRLYDGSYTLHSAPILLLPSATLPYIKAHSSVINSDGSLTISSILNIPYFALAYRFLSPPDLSLWSDIIHSVDIFISEPIYTFSQSKGVISPVTLRTLLLSGPFQNWHYASSDNPASSDSDFNNNHRFNPDHDHATGALSSADPFLIGHFSYGLQSPPEKHTLAPDSANNILSPISQPKYWLSYPNDKFEEQITSCANFYKYASIPLSDISDDKQMHAPLPRHIYESDLSNLLSRPTLPDEYQSHFSIIPSILFNYNSRLNLAGLSATPPTPLPVAASVQAQHYDSEILDDNDNVITFTPPTSITVFSRINGVRTFSSYSVPEDPNYTHSTHLPDNPRLYPFHKSHFPNFIYHPDPSAYAMSIHCGDTSISIPLSPHPTLNGAFWYGDLAPDPVPPADKQPSLPDTSSLPDRVDIRNKIYTSEVNNPFIFPVSGINTIGSADIIGISTAAKALSQGQFGQFPLYAFTSDGIWALEVNSNGSFYSRQPISRDVCINPDAITQIDSAVLFPSDRGIMQISGSVVSCISDNINSQTPFNLLDSLPLVQKLHSLLGDKHQFINPDGSPSLDSCFPQTPFLHFIRSCRMLYNYINQQIIIFNPSCSYAYTLSLQSALWGIAHSDLRLPVNSYPDAFAVTHSNHLVNLSSTNQSPLPGLLITRPLKLDLPDTLKTVDTVIQRGNFAPGHVQSVLYGSRDLINWHLVWSSRDHYLRGFRGSPYKYFRIALICFLSPGESISGASISFTPKLVNKPR